MCPARCPAISEKFDQSLPALLIGKIITSIVNNSPTYLQMALAVLLINSKEIVSHMYDYRITYSYDELLRFKKSSAVAAAKYLAEHGIISDAKHGLVQVVSDNIATDISSPNEKALTHSLAMNVMKPTCDNHPSPDAAIRRLQRHEISQAIEEIIGEQSSVYYGQKNSAMPQVPTPSLPSDFMYHEGSLPKITLHYSRTYYNMWGLSRM